MEERLSRKFAIVSGIFGKKLRGFDLKKFEERILSEFSKELGCSVADVDSKLKTLTDAEILPLISKCFIKVKQEFLSTHELKRKKGRRAVPK